MNLLSRLAQRYLSTSHQSANVKLDSERGQVLVIFAFGFIAIICMLALLIDGANGLVTRRHVQDAGDAAAQAAATIMQDIRVDGTRGCSTTGGENPGPPRAALVNKVMQSLRTNLSPDFSADNVTIICATGWNNSVIRVEISVQAPQFFSTIWSSEGLQIGTRSAAVNGLGTGPAYSVVELNPGHPSWNQNRGCPSVLLSGGPTVILDSSMYINSACPNSGGGAMAGNGGASSITINNGGGVRIVGGYNPGQMSITPTPITGVAPLADPLAGLPPLNTAGLTVRRTSQLVLSSGVTLIQPGIYQGGIQLKSQATIVMQPGIYVMQGGGFDMGAQSKAFSVKAGTTTSSNDTWATDCPAGSCGVLLYNTPSTSGTLGSITVSAGATLKLRAYNPDIAEGAAYEDYRNLLIWQNGTPVPTSSYAQPVIQLGGGGTVNVSGTIYAPSAGVAMSGGSGGSGGSADTTLTLQFITYDLTMKGNSKFHFIYSQGSFTRPTDYGLVE